MKVLASDVSKDNLVIFDGNKRAAVLNSPSEINALLKGYDKDWAVVMEPTSTYHMELAERAHRAGHIVYLVNPRVMSKFREARSYRNKSDEKDAECLHEFGVHYGETLRPWEPLPEDLERLRKALKRHRKITQARVRIAQTMEGHTSKQLTKTMAELVKLADKLEEDAISAARAVDEDYYNRLLEAPGFGNYSACAFTFIMRSRDFESADSVRAFIGMDLCIRDSGKKRGKRSLTKCGDGTLRHAATCAGRGILNSKYGRAMNLALKAKGRQHPERLIIAARKQIRIAFALSKTTERFNPQKFTWTLDKQT
jgi:transposase